MGGWMEYNFVGSSRHALTFIDLQVQSLHLSHRTALDCVLDVAYLRICSSNSTVLRVSFNLGTVNRRPAHN